MREMSSGGVVNLRGPALFKKAMMSLLPGWELRCFLGPMDNRGFVTPSEKLGHNVAVGAVRAEGIHGRVVFPGCDGPKSIFRFAQQAAAKETLGAFGLARGFHGVPNELREIEQGSDAQASYRNKRHKSPAHSGRGGQPGNSRREVLPM